MADARFGDVQARLSEFYEHRGDGPLETKPYFVVTGDDITYFFDGRAASTDFLSEVVDDGSARRRAGATLISHVRSFPPLVHLVPNLSRTTLRVPASGGPDLVILRSRVSVVDFERDVVCKFPLEADAEMDTEISARRGLPADIRTPALVEADGEFPFLCEEFVPGRTVRSSLDDWPHIFDALRDLTTLYRDGDLRYVPVADVLSDVQAAYDAPVVERTLDVLEDLSLPAELAVGRIHGDLAVRNLRYNDEGVFIFDWQDHRRDFLLKDFFRPLHRIASKTDTPEIYRGMIHGSGRPAGIAAEYSREIGPLAFRDDEFHEGLPLLYLLCSFDFEGDWQNNWRGETFRTLLAELESGDAVGRGG